MPKSSNRRYSRFAPYARTAAKVFANGYNAYNQFTRLRDQFRGYGFTTGTQTVKRKRWDKGGVTAQHDYKLQYVKKRMPKGKRLRWKRFVKKVRAVEIGERGLITEVYNSSVTYTADTNTQAILEAHLFSYGGAAKGGSDLAYITKTAETLPAQQITYGVDGATISDSKDAADAVYGRTVGMKAPILFQSAVLDITYTNNSEDSVEMDLYYINYKGRPTTNAKQFTGPEYDTLEAYRTLVELNNNIYSQYDTISDEYAVWKAVPGVAAPTFEAKLPTKLQFRGVTIFDCGELISRAKLKVLKKEKFIMPPGSSVTKQIRIPKNILFKEPVEYSSGWFGKLTQSIIGVAKCVNPEGSTNISQKWTRCYKYTMEGQKDRKSLYLQD